MSKEELFLISIVLFNFSKHKSTYFLLTIELSKDSLFISLQVPLIILIFCSSLIFIKSEKSF